MSLAHHSKRGSVGGCTGGLVPHCANSPAGTDPAKPHGNGAHSHLGVLPGVALAVGMTTPAVSPSSATCFYQGSSGVGSNDTEASGGLAASNMLLKK